MFARFQVRYGHKWTSAMQGVERVAVSEWSQLLAGLTPTQIKHGLDTWREDWPPSAPEFRKCCTGSTGAVIPPYHRKFEPVTDHTRLLSSDERNARRETIQAGIADLRAALRGTLDS